MYIYLIYYTKIQGINVHMVAETLEITLSDLKSQLRTGFNGSFQGNGEYRFEFLFLC